jgi:nicotinamide-nucleotide amidase
VQAEIVAIGTELLLGEIIDTNSAWIAQQLTTCGLNLFYTHTVGDNVNRIKEVLRTCLERSDVVITTGGLGPTVDDWTRDAVAAACDCELVLDEALVTEIATFFAQRGRPMTENNRKQAMIPEGAMVIHNPVGTAPAFAIERKGHFIISLPGVPHEMKHLMEHQILPLLQERFNLTGTIKSRILHTCGIGESALGDKITDLMQLSNPTVGTAAHPGQTDVRITVKAENDAQAEVLIAPVENELRLRLGDWIYGADAVTLPGMLLQLLIERRLSLATFETACAGQLAPWLAKEAGAPGCYLGGLVLTDTRVLNSGQPSADSAAKPDSSQEEADAAAVRVRQLLGADLGLAVTGTIEQDAQDDSPAYLCLATPDGLIRTLPRRGRAGAYGRGWLLHSTLDLVRRYLLHLPLV